MEDVNWPDVLRMGLLIYIIAKSGESGLKPSTHTNKVHEKSSFF